MPELAVAQVAPPAAPGNSDAPESAVAAANHPDSVQHLDLDIAAQLATKQSPAVIVAGTDVSQKAENLTADRRYWRPTLSLQNTTEYGRGSSTSFFAVQKIDEPGEPSYSAYAEGGYLLNIFNFTLPLYSQGTFFGHDTPMAIQDDGNHSMSTSNLELQTVNMSNQAVVAYFNAMMAKEQLAIQQNTLKEKLKELENVSHRIASKVEPASDRLIIESAIATAQAGVNTDTSLFKVSQIQLCSLLSLPLSRQLDLADVADPPAVPADLSALIDDAVVNNPQVKSQQAAIQVAQGLLKQVRGEYLPTVNLTGQYLDASNLHNTIIPSAGYVGVAVTVPITTFGQASAKIEAKSINVDESKQTLDLQRSVVAQNVAVAYQNLVSANEQIPALKKRVEQYQFIENADRTQYLQGVVELKQVIDDEGNTFQAELQLVSGKYAAWIARANLIAAVGKPYSSKIFLASQ